MYIESFLNDELSKVQITKELFSNILLATIEAVSNGIKHGNKFDYSKNIFISVELYLPIIQITVEDEGSGFDTSSLPNPLRKEKLEIPNGRGLFIMKKYTDALTFEDRGRRVIMDFIQRK